MYNNDNKSYNLLHGCLFGSPVHNLQSQPLARRPQGRQYHSIAPSDYEQDSSKIHPLRFHICF